MVRAAFLLFSFLLVVVSPVRSENLTPQQKLDQLIQLLQDPDIRNLTASQKPDAATSPSDIDAHANLMEWEGTARSRIDTVLAAIPRIPGELAATSARIREDARANGYGRVFIVFLGLVAAGAIAEICYRRIRPGNGSPLTELIPVMIFCGTAMLAFFAADWPRLPRILLLAYLGATFAYRLGAVLIHLAIPTRTGLRRRALLFLFITVLSVATSIVARPLGTDPAVASAISYCLSVVLLLLALEMLWSTSLQTLTVRIGWTLFIVAVWVLWCIGLREIFWLGVYVIILPGLLRSVGKAASMLGNAAPGSLRTILLVRGSRAVVIALAVGWLALVWMFDRDALGRNNAMISMIFYGVLQSVIILLLADLLWQLAKNWIDHTLTNAADMAGRTPAEAARQARFRTLLPIFRHALAVVVAVVTILIILAQLGVQIAPLIAGAGIFGVAIGFGSQTLVKDVISGIFYMLDDAFRVGEYIQAKSYKGTVEGFSLRSVRLRHHRGPVYTVPFGELGAVENMSRDWVIDKFQLKVGFDTDLDKARKIVKTIGADLQADPELGPLFIEPLKMKGVEEFSDYGIVLSFAMTTVPGRQAYIRRKAYAMIRNVFQQNGIYLAQPTVQVGGDKDLGGEAAGALTTVQMDMARQKAEAEAASGKE